MRRLIAVAVFIMSGLCVFAQVFRGDMAVGGYSQKEVRVELKVNSRGVATITMRRVKFARMMPVRLDVVLSPVTVAEGSLRADAITPTAKGKDYEKYKVSNLTGRVSADRLAFRCAMGDKTLSYSGKKE